MRLSQTVDERPAVGLGLLVGQGVLHRLKRDPDGQGCLTLPQGRPLVAVDRGEGHRRGGRHLGQRPDQRLVVDLLSQHERKIANDRGDARQRGGGRGSRRDHFDESGKCTRTCLH